MEQQKPYILGLDLGTNSVGWAVVDCEIAETTGTKVDKKTGEVIEKTTVSYRPLALRALNSRIFQEMVDAKTRVPKNQHRRQKRSERVRKNRYQKKRKDLIVKLIENNLLPDNFNDCPENHLNSIDRGFAEKKLGKEWSKKWEDIEKYHASVFAIRAYAVDRELQPYEMGRLLLHLQRRRGYFSNRGAKYIDLIKYLELQPDQKEKLVKENEKKQDSDSRKVLGGISELQRVLDGRTIGQFIWDQSLNKAEHPCRITGYFYEKPRKKEDDPIQKAAFYAQREMYEEEFKKIWEQQSKTLKISNLYDDIYYLIFNQLPLQSQKSRVGKCNFLQKNKRAATATLEFQEFRIHCLINNIRIGEEPLSPDQRSVLYEALNNPNELNKEGRVSLGKVAELLDVNRRDINYDRGGSDDDPKAGFTGNRTVQAISNIIGYEHWNDLPEEGKYSKAQLVEDLITVSNKRALYQRLADPDKWGSARNSKEKLLI